MDSRQIDQSGFGPAHAGSGIGSFPADFRIGFQGGFYGGFGGRISRNLFAC
jgi:hypothetical protein